MRAEPPLVVLAAAAHPDDIEFMMAGTLLRLAEGGACIHMWNLCDGRCGSTNHDGEETARLRCREAGASASLAGAHWHAPIAQDLNLFYDRPTLARTAAVLRQVAPHVVLTHPREDYMEDHEATARLVVTAAFARGMANFAAEPPTPPVNHQVAVYHALPHGLLDGNRRRARPTHYVDVTPVMDRKRAMLASHQSQQEWLDSSQGMDSYLNEMERMAREVGRWSGHFALAEGWRRHNMLGFGPPDHDPLAQRLGDGCWIDEAETARFPDRDDLDPKRTGHAPARQ